MTTSTATESATISIHIIVAAGTPSRCLDDVDGALDYPVEIHATDEAGETLRIDGSITMVPDLINGGMCPVGDSVDHWISGSIVSRLYNGGSWLAFDPRYAKAIARSLMGGVGEETIEFSL